MDMLSQMRASERNDTRIPMAWQRREMTLNNPYKIRHPSSSITSTSSDDREEVPIVRHQYRPLSRQSNLDRHEERLDHYATIRNERLRNFSLSRNERMDPYPIRNNPFPDVYFNGPFRRNELTGTLRSTRSVPSLAFAAGIEAPDPCPLHGGNMGPMRRYGSLLDIRTPPIGGPLNLAGLDKKIFYGSRHSMIGCPPAHHFQLQTELPQYMPPHTLNHMMRPPPHLPILMEPIAMRDPFNKTLTLFRNGPPQYTAVKKQVDPFCVGQFCCKGHLIILWIILGVVTAGVILGIVLGLFLI